MIEHPTEKPRRNTDAGSNPWCSKGFFSQSQLSVQALSLKAVLYCDVAGRIILQNQIDREVTPTVSFTVIATDSGSPPLSSNITFNVTVLDANDNDPKFQNTSYIFSVPEDAVMQTVVAIVNATDADEGPNADVTFDLADNVYDFVINTTTVCGVIVISALSSN